MNADFTIVTVVHRTDLPLIKLQARSLNRYLDRSFVREIIVVDNSSTTPIRPEELLPQYGSLPVHIRTAPPIAASGWRTQQVHKMLIARQVTTRYYLLLDAKNHLINRVSRSTFVASDGRLRLGANPYHKHPLHEHLIRSCQYFDIDPNELLDRFVQTITPFPLATMMVRHLLDQMEPFERTFLRSGGTEFFLFAAYLLSIGQQLEGHYVFDTWFTANLWKWHSNEEMQEEITRHGCDFFSVHRGAFSNMNAQTQALLALLWYQRKLFASYADAIRFVRGCASAYRP